MSDIVARLSSVSSSWRVAVVDYKDDPETEDSAYRTQLAQPFTTGAPAINDAIDGRYADGGGDTPESVYSGMLLALDQPWRSGVEKALVVMGDAPAHDPEPGTGYTLKTVTDKALAVDPANAYPVVVGDDADAISSMDALASGTSGVAFTSPKATAVPDAVTVAVSAAGTGLVADAGGPYLGTTSAPVAMSGASSSNASARCPCSSAHRPETFEAEDFSSAPQPSMTPTAGVKTRSSAAPGRSARRDVGLPSTRPEGVPVQSSTPTAALPSPVSSRHHKVVAGPDPKDAHPLWSNRDDSGDRCAHPESDRAVGQNVRGDNGQ